MTSRNNMVNSNSNNFYSKDQGVRERNLREIISTIWTGRWIILIATLVVFNVFLVKTVYEDPVYQAKTTVFVGAGGQMMPLGFMGESTKNIINEIQILRSRNLARSVAEAIMEITYLDEDSLEYIPSLVITDESGDFLSIASIDIVTGRIQRRMEFGHIPNSDIIEVSAYSTNPREAALLANAYATIYHHRHFKGSREHSRRVREFLETQLHERERALKEAEDNLQNYMERHGVVTVDAESRNVINQVAQLEARREELEVQIHATETRLQSIREQLAEQEPEVVRGIASADNPYIRRIQEQIAELEIRRDQVVVQNPQAIGEQQYQNRLRQIEDELQGLRNTLRRRSDEFVQTLSAGDEGFLRQLKQRIAEGQIELQGLLIQRNSTERLLSQYESQFERLPEMNMQYARLERAKRSNEQLYLMIEEKFNESIIAEQSEFGSVNIVDNALVPISPVSPNVKMNLAVGLVLGLGVGVGFVFLKEALSIKIKTPEDLKKDNFVNLATIAVMYREVKRFSNKGWVPTKGRVLSAYLITLHNPLSPTSEAFRALRTNLQYAEIDKPLKTFVVTSPNPGEGKSTVSTNLAITYAQGDKKVLLIDGDLRKSTLHNILDFNKKPGLTNILFNNLDLSSGIQKTVVDNLKVISSGDTLANPADLLGSQKMQSLLEKLKEQFDIIIFDTPPVLAATDASILSTISDGVIVVASSRRTKLDDMSIVRENIEGVHGRILGTVLNNFDHRSGYGSKYTYQYYQYGSYSNGDGNGSGKKKLNIFK